MSYDTKVADEVEKARQEAMRAANIKMEEKIVVEVGKLKDDIAAERAKVYALLSKKAKFSEESEAFNAERGKMLSLTMKSFACKITKFFLVLMALRSARNKLPFCSVFFL